MSIRPIDMQVLIPKSQNISNINQNIMNKSENMLQHSYNRDKEITKKKLNQVNTLNKKENPLIKNNYDKKRQNQDNRKNKKEKEDDTKDAKHLSNSIIDIKV